MQYASLGRSGLKVSRICLGMMSYGSSKWRPWVLDEDAARPFVKKALDLGVTFFDTADMYSEGMSEEVLGRAVRDFAKREDLVIATKVFYPMGKSPNDRGLSRKHILSAIDASLRRLGMDYVDLYQIHRYDPETPIEETMEALNDVVRSGKARYIGASSMYAWQLARMLDIADQHGWTRFISMQNHYNLAYREEEREMLPLCREDGIGVIPWSPLGRGLLAGKRREGQAGDSARAKSDAYSRQLYIDEDLEVARRVVETGSKRGVSPARIALAWLLSRPGVVAPIVGATHLDHLEDAAGAVDVSLSEEENGFLEEPYRPHVVRGIE
ncbi:MAG TPA: aldo/keto reductase [Thermoanaerobaculia bacterium]|nr:aldo/keto reductase [Thermoanaerobaculia bacterium]